MKMPARDFARDYELGRSPALLELERCVLGCDYGATSWTTREEASRIAERLELQPRDTLLDLGAGSGWPGLYLAQFVGCNVVLVDLPLVGLRFALERAAADGLKPRCHAIVANGATLPFRDAVFDAISHSDVLCCLEAKLSVLQACRRAARAGAKMAFAVIAPASSLSESEREFAIASGPPFVDVSGDYADLLAESGWELLERWDMSEEFARSLRTSIGAMNARAAAITEVFGPEDFSERLKRRQATLAAIERRVLKREIFVAQC